MSTCIFGDYKLNKYEPTDSDRLIIVHNQKMEITIIITCLYTLEKLFQNHLKTKGYNCVDEISREIISEQIDITDGEILPWKNLSEKLFQKEYLN